MATRTQAQLDADFPVDTLAHLQASMTKFDQLVRDGQLSTPEITQVIGQFGNFMDAKVEAAAIAAPTAAYTGTAGTTTRTYHAIPNYPIADPSGFQPTVKNLAGKPPYGRPSPAESLNCVPDTRTRRYIGGTTAATDVAAAKIAVANTQAALDATDYVTVTAPNPGGLHVPNVQYDIVVEEQGNANVYLLVATNVAPGASIKDTGAGFMGRDCGAGVGLYGAVYSLPAHTEVAWDATDSKVVYGVNTVTVTAD